MDAETGEQLWAFETDDEVSSSPTAVAGTVFVGSDDGNLYAVDAETAERQWAFETDGMVESSPTVVDGTVFIRSNGGYLYAVDAKTGEELWALEIGPAAAFRKSMSSPTVVGGTVFVGNDDGNLYAVNMESGEQQWMFETGDPIRSSPTVVSETVLVGSNGGNLYAVDMETGEQQWTFEASNHSVRSSPTVADGIAFFGSVGFNEGHLYAIDTGIDGSSEDSRVVLGTLGHHGDWRYADQSIDIPAYALYASWARNNPGPLAVGGVAAGGYLLRRRRKDAESDSTYDTDDAPADAASSDADQPPDAADRSRSDDSSRVDELRSEADAALEAAVAAKESNDLGEAADAYRAALTGYRAALDELDAGAAETRAEIEASVESTQGALSAVETRRERRRDLAETLEAGERNFQVAVVAYARGSRTLARIRFRQARDAFEEATELIEGGDHDLLAPPVEANVEPDRTFASAALRELPALPEAATAALSDAGVDTLGELESAAEPPWTPPAVEALSVDLDDGTETTATLLSWWNGDGNYAFDAAATVSRRRDQAEYGFDRCS
nr:PQQ-binding-like beta-propeller repeat protein [Halorubrum ezzemoulense]